MSSFNLVEYDSESRRKKLQYDQQMVNARLKGRENQAELKRANMELYLRKRKAMSHFKEHLHSSRRDEQSYT